MQPKSTTTGAQGNVGLKEIENLAVDSGPDSNPGMVQISGKTKVGQKSPVLLQSFDK